MVHGQVSHCIRQFVAGLSKQSLSFKHQVGNFLNKLPSTVLISDIETEVLIQFNENVSPAATKYEATIPNYDNDTFCLVW